MRNLVMDNGLLQTLTINWDIFRDIIFILGFVISLLTLIILVHAWRGERPILKFNVIDCFHVFYEESPYSDPTASYIYVNMIVDNIGEKNTTIKDIIIRKTIPSGLINDIRYDFLRPQTILAHDSQKLNLEFTLPKIELAMIKLIIEFDVIHTHGKKRVKANSRKR